MFRVVFPLTGLDLAPWVHKDCVSSQVRMELKSGVHIIPFTAIPNVDLLICEAKIQHEWKIDIKL